MGETYTIEIRNGSKKAYRYRKALQGAGFSWDGDCWRKDGSSGAAHWEHWCLMRGLRMKAIGTDTQRGGNYRKDFFERNPPMFGKWYCCAYCGRFLKKDRVQVDHIIPVDLAKSREDIRRRIKAYGWSSVNDPANLCAACGTCNRRKSNKGGLWILRGRLGKKKQTQIIILTLKIIFFVSLAVFIILSMRFLGSP